MRTDPLSDVESTAGGTRFDPSPIGLYFAQLWYAEKLYPLIFTVGALERVSTTAKTNGHKGATGRA